jgi:hypothetical protein
MATVEVPDAAPPRTADTSDKAPASTGGRRLGSTAYAGRMNDTPDRNEPGRQRRRFWHPSSASEWIELAIYVFFGLIALLAGVGWLVART